MNYAEQFLRSWLEDHEGVFNLQILINEAFPVGVDQGTIQQALTTLVRTGVVKEHKVVVSEGRWFLTDDRNIITGGDIPSPVLVRFGWLNHGADGKVVTCYLKVKPPASNQTTI